jgi:hypothetical protein
VVINIERTRSTEGVRVIAAELSRLPGSYRVLHDLDLPDSEITIEHLVIGATGVFAITCRAYSGTVRHGDGTLWHGRKSLERDILDARDAARSAERFLGRPCRAVLTFTGSALQPPRATVEGLTACRGDALLGYLATEPRVMQPHQIELLADRSMPYVRAAREIVDDVVTRATLEITPVRPRTVPRAALRRLAIAAALIVLAIPVSDMLMDRHQPTTSLALHGSAAECTARGLGRASIC